MGSNPKLGVRKDECKEISVQVNIGGIGQVPLQLSLLFQEAKLPNQPYQGNQNAVEPRVNSTSRYSSYQFRFQVLPDKQV